MPMDSPAALLQAVMMAAVAVQKQFD